MKDWNSQEVLTSTGPLPQRQEDDFDRQLLAQALRIWSTGKQDFLLPGLNLLGEKVIWVVGQTDQKYLQLAEMISLPNKEIIAGAGHRIPWDQPQRLTALLKRFT